MINTNLKMYKFILLLSCFVLETFSHSNFCNLATCASTYGPENVRCRRTNKNASCYYEQMKASAETFDLGNVVLKAYRGHDDRTFFNVSFTDIAWTDLNLRFKRIGSPKTCSYINFQIDENTTIPADKNFYYDCPWSDVDSEGTIGSFEYEYKNLDKISTKNYTFFIPRHEKLEKADRFGLELFLYVDITNLDRLKLLIQVPTKNVLDILNITDYNIYVYRIRNDIEEQIDQGLRSNNMAVDGIIEFPYDVLSHGQYYFEVEPFDNKLYNGGNFKSTKTPKIIIPKTRHKLLIGIVGISTLIPIFLFIIYWYRPRPDLQDSQNKILFVYDPTHSSHVSTVSKLTEILKENFNMDIMLDKWDIPGTTFKDPFTWFSQAFYNASHVVFFVSPNIKAPPLKGSLYKDLYILGLRLSKEELSKKNSNKKILVVKFPYSKKSVSPDLVNFKNYMLPKDLNSFLNKLQNKKFWDKFEKKTLQFTQIIDSLTELIHRAGKDMEINTDDSDSITIFPPEYRIICQDAEDVDLLVPNETKMDLSKNENNYPYAYKAEDIDLDGKKSEKENNKKNVDKDYKYKIDEFDL